MTDQATNFLGIPIDGDINRADKRTPQRSLSDLEPLIRAVLDDDGIVEFGWTQYTPYFNDGDPCVFSVGEPWFKTTADAQPDTDEDEYEDGYEDLTLYGHPTMSDMRWDSAKNDYVPIERDAETLARYKRCRALDAAIDSGAFDDVLLDAFGDHAKVVVRRTGITVDEYSHD